jgi:EAL domain-containing protein (putative c-di-GMP-specific phosphodiesterase class I)
LALADLRFEFNEMYQGPGSDDFFSRLRSWRERGAIFALDDFGQGYSGLRVLYELGPEVLKLDRFFISGIEADSAKRKIVSAVAGLARELGITVLAEGVETDAEFRLCAELGCDLAQGYFISPPLLSVPESLAQELTRRVEALGQRSA